MAEEGCHLVVPGEGEGQGANRPRFSTNPFDEEEDEEPLSKEFDNEPEEQNADVLEKDEKTPEDTTKMEEGDEKKKSGKKIKFRMSLKKKNVKEEKEKQEGANDKTSQEDPMDLERETSNQIRSGTPDPSKDREKELEKGDKDTKPKKEAEDVSNSAKKDEKEKSWRGNFKGKIKMFFQESSESETSPSVREDTTLALPETPPMISLLKSEETNSFDFVSFPEVPDTPPQIPAKPKEGGGLSFIKVFDKFYKKSDSNPPSESGTPGTETASLTLSPLSDQDGSQMDFRPLSDADPWSRASSDDDHEGEAIFEYSDGSGEGDHPDGEMEDLPKFENQLNELFLVEDDEGTSELDDKKQILRKDAECDNEGTLEDKVEDAEDQEEPLPEEGTSRTCENVDHEGEVEETDSSAGVDGVTDGSSEALSPPSQKSSKTGSSTPTSGSSSLGFSLSSFRKLGWWQKEPEVKPAESPEVPQEPQPCKEEPVTKTSAPTKEPKEGLSKMVQLLQRGGSRLAEQQRRLKSQIWSSVVTIVLVEGKNLLPMDSDGTSDPYVKFRLGNEKYKSKTELRTLSPRWVEQFDFHLFEDQSQVLEITVWDKDARTKDDFMGRCNLDLSQFEREQTHQIWAELEDGAGSIFLLFTISGTTSAETISDLHTYQENPREEQTVRERYKIRRSLHSLRDIGFLKVKVYRAQGLASADIGGKSDPFCVLELINSRLQTQTEYKTLSPSWNKIFTFNVKDIHSVLEITVYDEDRDHKVEFLGKIAIPLLRIRDHEKKWYALKDKKLRARAKGNNPEILLECSVVWNRLRAAIRTFTPKEEKFMQQELKFKRQVFIRNVNRLRSCILCFIELGKFVKSCWDWESPVRSIAAFVVFLVVTYCFEVYMLPIMLLLLFLRNYIQRWTMSKVISLVGSVLHREEESELSGDEEDIDDEDKDKNQNPEEEKKSLKERLQAIQEVTATVQNAIGFIASIGESCKNTFNFSVPFLSWLAIICLAVGAVLLYYIPVRYLVMLWGINKFSRQLLRPHSMVNNELLDFLSRVPDDEELKDYRELRQIPHFPDDRRRDARKKKNL